MVRDHPGLSSICGMALEPEMRTWTTQCVPSGRLQTNLDVANLPKNSRVVRYEGVILVAFCKVGDGLTARGTYG